MPHSKASNLCKVMFVDAWSAVSWEVADSETQTTPTIHGQAHDEKAIPAGLRRRLDKFGRLVVSSALAADPTNMDAEIIFCSRYGDLALATKLVSSLAVDEILSPAGFSMSVHNALAGITDIIRGAKAGHTAIAAGAQSLGAGLLEAAIRLDENPSAQLLLLYADAPLPAPLDELSAQNPEPLILAMSLSAASTDKTIARIQMPLNKEASAEGEPTSEELAKIFIKLLGQMDEAAPLIWRMNNLTWAFNVGAHAEA